MALLDRLRAVLRLFLAPRGRSSQASVDSLWKRGGKIRS